MKKLLPFLFLIPLFISVASCDNDTPDPEKGGEDVTEEGVVIGYANLSDADSWFDEIFIKDEENYRLTKRKPDGSREWDMFVSKQDTLMAYYNADGLLKGLSYNNTHIILGAYYQNYVKLGILLEDNSTEVVELETEINWDQQVKNNFKSRTPLSDLDREQAAIETFNTYLIDQIITKVLVSNGVWTPPISPGGLLLTVAQLGAISSATTLEEVQIIGFTGDALSFAYSAQTGGVYGILSFLNAKVWGRVAYYIYTGIKNDDFSSEDLQRVFLKRQFIENLELVITQASFRPDNQSVTWEGGSFDFNLWIEKVGGNSLESLVVIRDGNLPEWIDEASPNYNGKGWQLHVTVQPNFSQQPRDCYIQCSVLGTGDHKQTPRLHLTQTGQISVSPNPIVFSKKESLPVTVIAYAGETWEIKSIPDWCEVSTQGIMNGFTITPKQYRDGLEGEVVLYVSTLGGGGYDLSIPVMTGLGWDFTKWHVTGRVQMSAGKESEPYDVDDELVLGNISETPIHISQEGSDIAIFVNDAGQLVYEINVDVYDRYSDGYVSGKGQYVIAFDRTSATTAKGVASGTVRWIDHVDGKNGYHDETDVKLTGSLDAVLLTDETPYSATGNSSFGLKMLKQRGK